MCRSQSRLFQGFPSRMARQQCSRRPRLEGLRSSGHQELSCQDWVPVLDEGRRDLGHTLHALLPLLCILIHRNNTVHTASAWRHSAPDTITVSLPGNASSLATVICFFFCGTGPITTNYGLVTLQIHTGPVNVPPCCVPVTPSLLPAHNISSLIIALRTVCP